MGGGCVWKTSRSASPGRKDSGALTLFDHSIRCGWSRVAWDTAAVRYVILATQEFWLNLQIDRFPADC